jgi:hypothetical protein
MRGSPDGRPLPDIADHVVHAVANGGEGAHRRGTGKAVGQFRRYLRRRKCCLREDIADIGVSLLAGVTSIFACRTPQPRSRSTSAISSTTRRVCWL